VNPTNDRQQQLRTGRQLDYFTLCWNLTEAAVAVGAGVFAGSIALIGFGIDWSFRPLPGFPSPAQPVFLLRTLNSQFSWFSPN
jgi:hypothetical protein